MAIQRITTRRVYPAHFGLSRVDEVMSIIYKICDSVPSQRLRSFVPRSAVTPERSISANNFAGVVESVANAQTETGCYAISMSTSRRKLVSSNTLRLATTSLPPRPAERFDVIVFSCELDFLARSRISGGSRIFVTGPRSSVGIWGKIARAILPPTDKQ